MSNYNNAIEDLSSFPYFDYSVPRPYKINKPPTDRKVRIYCDGIYDLFHFGHAKALEQAKKSFKDVYLLVGVCNDALTNQNKGKTVMNQEERYESVRHCKWVDEVIENAPWSVDDEFLEKHLIDYVAHDEIPYKSKDSDDVYEFVKLKGKFLPTQRTDGVSTSDLITRIVRDYDSYVRRNLERGVSAKDLNVGFFKQRELKVKKNIEELRTIMKETLEYWDSKRNLFIEQFTKKFGEEFISKFLNRSQKNSPRIENSNIFDNEQYEMKQKKQESSSSSSESEYEDAK